MSNDGGVRVFVTLTLVRGDNLPVMDVGGTSDPYVSLKFSKGVDGKAPYSEGKIKSKCIPSTVNPEWHEPIRMVLPPTTNILLKLFDKDFAKDDFMGEVEFSVQELAQASHENVAALQPISKPLQRTPHSAGPASITVIPDVSAAVPPGQIKIISVRASGFLVQEKTELMFQYLDGDKKMARFVTSKCDRSQSDTSITWSSSSSSSPLMSSSISHEPNGFTPFVSFVLVHRARIIGCATARLYQLAAGHVVLNCHRFGCRTAISPEALEVEVVAMFNPK